MFLTEIISDLFGRTDGAVTVISETGEEFSSTDLLAVGRFASECDDPWIDLVTSDGEATCGGRKMTKKKLKKHPDTPDSDLKVQEVERVRRFRRFRTLRGSG